jgi:hypothetical protein
MMWRVDVMAKEEPRCFFDTINGVRRPAGIPWSGGTRRELGRASVRVGVLLDLDRGTMTLYEDGVEQPNTRTGLSEYCWAVCLFFQSDSVKIEAGEPPP